AGASTLAELAACQKAAVIVPFPWATDNHQQENAETLAKENAAFMILQKDFTAQKLISVIEDFKENPSKITEYEKRIAKFFKPQSAETIAQFIMENSIEPR